MQAVYRSRGTLGRVGRLASNCISSAFPGAGALLQHVHKRLSIDCCKLCRLAGSSHAGHVPQQGHIKHSGQAGQTAASAVCLHMAALRCSMSSQDSIEDLQVGNPDTDL